jgi:hypothetical protein
VPVIALCIFAHLLTGFIMFSHVMTGRGGRKGGKGGGMSTPPINALCLYCANLAGCSPALISSVSRCDLDTGQAGELGGSLDLNLAVVCGGIEVEVGTRLIICLAPNNVG